MPKANSPGKLGPPRLLALAERDLLNRLLQLFHCPSANKVRLDELQVQSMADGGMGSLYLRLPNQPDSPRKFGKRIAELQLIDADGMPVVVSLNVDQNGDLFELDIWKVDFTPTKILQ